MLVDIKQRTEIAGGDASRAQSKDGRDKQHPYEGDRACAIASFSGEAIVDKGAAS